MWNKTLLPMMPMVVFCIFNPLIQILLQNLAYLSRSESDLRVSKLLRTAKKRCFFFLLEKRKNPLIWKECKASMNRNILAYLFLNKMPSQLVTLFFFLHHFSVLLITFGGERHLSANELMHFPLSIANFLWDWEGKWKHQQ